jgi:hypothetical protein
MVREGGGLGWSPDFSQGLKDGEVCGAGAATLFSWKYFKLLYKAHGQLSLSPYCHLGVISGLLRGWAKDVSGPIFSLPMFIELLRGAKTFR